MGPEVTDQAAANKTSSDSSNIGEKTQLYQSIQQTLANTPAIDMEKVAAAKNKIAKKELEILGTKSQRLASAKRIAKQLIDEQSPAELNKPE